MGKDDIKFGVTFEGTVIILILVLPERSRQASLNGLGGVGVAYFSYGRS